MLVVNIIMALIFNSSDDARPAVCSCFRLCASLTSDILGFLGTAFFAGIVINLHENCFK